MPTKKPSANELSTEILSEEFEYIAGTAFQANEDRARVASFYLVAVGSLVAALFSTQFPHVISNPKTINLLFSGLFFVLTLLGTLTVSQLARLRIAWYESVKAMNQVKDYVISRDKELAKVFRWQSNTLPPLYKPSSISFHRALEVALLSGLTFGAAIYFFQIGVDYICTNCNWSFTIAGAAFAFIFQLFFYKQLLVKN